MSGIIFFKDASPGKKGRSWSTSPMVFALYIGTSGLYFLAFWIIRVPKTWECQLRLTKALTWTYSCCKHSHGDQLTDISMCSQYQQGVTILLIRSYFIGNPFQMSLKMVQALASPVKRPLQVFPQILAETMKTIDARFFLLWSFFVWVSMTAELLKSLGSPDFKPTMLYMIRNSLRDC